MLKNSKIAWALASLILLPASAMAQEQTDKPVKKQEKTVEKVVEVELVEEEVANEKTTEEKAVVDVQTETVNVVEDEEETFVFVDDGETPFRFIELRGDNIPTPLKVIVRQLKNNKGGGAGPGIMLLETNGDGEAVLAKSDALKQLEAALSAISVDLDGSEKDAVEKHVIQILKNAKPNMAELKDWQLRLLKADAMDVEKLKEQLAGVNGTISITSSSSSSSEDGAEPKVVSNSQIRIIGPDGKVQEFEFSGDGKAESSIAKALEMIQKQSGKAPQEEAEEKIHEAMKRAQDAMKRARREEFNRSREMREQVLFEHAQKAAEAQERVLWNRRRLDSAKEKSAGQGIEKKLDLILNRLEKMQKEIDSLKRDGKNQD